MTDRNTIAAAYDAGVDEEYNRLVSTPLCEAEFMLVSELLSEYISEGSTVIDIGAGPGRYAEFLLSKNCNVGTIDLSALSLASFTKRINGNYGKSLLFSKTSCATELEWVQSESADAVLLMGPLYHLTSEEERTKAIANSYRILKKGGFVFSIFMSPYPKLNPLLEGADSILTNRELINTVQENCTTKVMFQGFEIEQYRCWPLYAREIMEKQDFITERIRNIEGVGSFYNKQNLSEFDNNNSKQALFRMLRNTCENPNLLGITHQYLYVGKKGGNIHL
jgi:ubiquinone/menaquinone biosynthesis C-methylase UbiE